MWPHIDKYPYSKETLYQSSISLEDNLHTADGGFVCWEKTHNLDPSFYHDIIDPKKTYSNEFLTINKSKISDITPRVLRVSAGTMIIWNSSLIHCNIPPLKDSKSDRLVAYVCMVPQSMLTKQQQKYLFKLKKNKRTTSHSPLNPTICDDDILYNKDTVIKYESNE